MAEEVEVSPGVGAAAFGTAEDATIEAACLGEIPDVVGEVKDAAHGCGARGCEAGFRLRNAEALLLDPDGFPCSQGT